MAPTSFETRDAAGEAEEEATVRKEESKTRKLTFTAVTGSREWTDPNGKVIRARLLACEAVGAEGSETERLFKAPKERPIPTQAARPGNPGSSILWRAEGPIDGSGWQGGGAFLRTGRALSPPFSGNP